MTIPLLHTLYEQEEALVKGCKEGTAPAQKALYDKHAGPLMVICLRYAGTKEDAKDLLMQALTECFRSIRNMEYRGEGSLQAWLKKITVNQCLMQLRKQRNSFCELDEGLEILHTGSEDHCVMARLSVKEIMRWIHALPPGYRTVFNLYVFEDMAHKDIAALLGISESTSKSQLHKARALLQIKITGSQKIAL